MKIERGYNNAKRVRNAKDYNAIIVVREEGKKSRI
jgi:hypothetical protein